MFCLTPSPSLRTRTEADTAKAIQEALDTGSRSGLESEEFQKIALPESVRIVIKTSTLILKDDSSRCLAWKPEAQTANGITQTLTQNVINRRNVAIISLVSAVVALPLIALAAFFGGFSLILVALMICVPAALVLAFVHQHFSSVYASKLQALQQRAESEVVINLKRQLKMIK